MSHKASNVGKNSQCYIGFHNSKAQHTQLEKQDPEVEHSEH